MLDQMVLTIEQQSFKNNLLVSSVKMDAITALHSRVSVNLLADPGPSDAQIESIIKAGMRACDHKSLTPWRFLVIQGEARKKFGKLMADTKEKMAGEPLDASLRAKLESKPFRAPCIIAVIAKIVEHEKVPEMEQILSAGASAQMMMVAAHALGLGAIWRSGSMMFDEKMRAGLGVNDKDHIVGFIYLGTPLVCKPVPELDPAEYMELWDTTVD